MYAALGISDYALQRINTICCGNIHSKFENSFNIKFDNFLFHAGNRNNLSCIGMSLPINAAKEILAQIDIGDIVTYKTHLLYLYTKQNVIQICLSSAYSMNLKVAVPKNQLWKNKLIEKLRDSNLEKKIGIEINESFKSAIKAMKMLVEKPNQSKSAINYLLGRGIGLTPSGDDILLGYSVGLILQGKENQFFQILSKCSLKETTDVSRAYLEAIIDGYCHQNVYALAVALSDGTFERIEPILESIMEIGHTSGCDMLYGLLIAMQIK